MVLDEHLALLLAEVEGADVALPRELPPDEGARSAALRLALEIAGISLRLGEQLPTRAATLLRATAWSEILALEVDELGAARDVGAADGELLELVVAMRDRLESVKVALRWRALSKGDTAAFLSVESLFHEATVSLDKTLSSSRAEVLLAALGARSALHAGESWILAYDPPLPVAHGLQSVDGLQAHLASGDLDSAEIVAFVERGLFAERVRSKGTDPAVADEIEMAIGAWEASGGTVSDVAKSWRGRAKAQAGLRRLQVPGKDFRYLIQPRVRSLAATERRGAQVQRWDDDQVLYLSVSERLPDDANNWSLWVTVRVEGDKKLRDARGRFEILHAVNEGERVLHSHQIRLENGRFEDRIEVAPIEEPAEEVSFRVTVGD